jgi:hypothetical protein
MARRIAADVEGVATRLNGCFAATSLKCCDG